VDTVSVIRDGILALSSLLGGHHRTENFDQGQSWSGSWFADSEGEKVRWEKAVTAASPRTPGISAPSVGILVTGSEERPTSSVLLPHQNIRKILGSFQLQILKEDQTQVNATAQKIQEPETKLGGNKVEPQRTRLVPVLLSDTVNSECNLHEKAGSKALSTAGRKAKCKPGSCDNLCKGPTAELGDWGK